MFLNSKVHSALNVQCGDLDVGVPCFSDKAYGVRCQGGLIPGDLPKCEGHGEAPTCTGVSVSCDLQKGRFEYKYMCG